MDATLTSAMLTDLLKSLAILGLFLIIGTILRAKVTIFQKLFLPANVIGGVLLLLLGPQCLNLLGKLGVPSTWFSYYNMLPGVLIVPVVAAVPLGLRLGNKGGSSSIAGNDFMKNVVPLIGIGLAVSMVQFAVGYLVHAVFSGAFDFYDVFGVELSIGYVGGHGTAGTLGNMLTELNLDYASLSQGVATTTATFGIVGGIVIGIAMINYAARKGHTAALAKPGEIAENMRVGYEKDMSKQASTGRETTMSCSIDTYAFHASIIFLACGLAYLAVKYSKALNIPVLKSFSAWAWGMIAMFIIWGIICKLKLDFMVDGKVKNHITGPFTDFAVIGAIASLPLKAVAAFIVPILVMVVIGYIVTGGLLWFLSKRFLKGCWFEQMIGTFGMATGVFITGVLLLRVADPDSETPALSSYSLSYTITSCVYFALLNTMLVLPMNLGALSASLIAFGATAVAVIFTAVSSRVLFGKEFKGN